MKLYCSKILLFPLPLTILLTSSSYVYNNNEPQTTTTSRVLSESDTESSIYDNDEEINSVKEIFERQTSQRLREYDERLQVKRQKRKEQRDKNIQKIIHKDKMEKNLAEKIEKGCLMCGCGLGSVAGSIGLFGGIVINIWKPVALKGAIAAALKANEAMISTAAKTASDAAGAAKVIELIQSTYSVDELGGTVLESYFAATSYKNASVITQAVSNQYVQTCLYVPSSNLYLPFPDPKSNITICRSVLNQTLAVSKPKTGISTIDGISTAVQNMVSEAEVSAKAAADIATKQATEATIRTSTETIDAACTQLYSAIGYSILAILIIVLIMLIIYLILRYRRKKKMKKKAQYTKLLNE
ncbi:rifin PIR protein, putative [Plasmodium reichenowi]|uniref:Rifin PIR protein, putative n=1 Tax=Plasmodium reichenowi TaxID=5854 RepID=A0A2P9DBG8_PLARE|nr:rifin PIR protein, putative [Plasmodium reichenowi]